MTFPAALRPVIAIIAGIGAVACLVAAQSWVYEHVERPVGRALCDTGCGMDSDPTDALFAFALAVPAWIVIAALLLVIRLRSRPAGRLLRVGLFVAVVVAAASSVVVVHRTNWLRGGDDISVCNAYPGRPAPQDPRRCAPDDEPASAAWLLAAGVLLAIGAIAAAGPTGRDVRRS